MQSTLAARLAALTLACTVASAATAQSSPPPDTWSNVEFHVGGSALLGFVGSQLTRGEHKPLVFAGCMAVGHAHELRNKGQPGNRYSGRDMVANAIGCGLGMWGSHVVLTHRGGDVQVGYVWRF